MLGLALFKPVYRMLTQFVCIVFIDLYISKTLFEFMWYMRPIGNRSGF